MRRHTRMQRPDNTHIALTNKEKSEIWWGLEKHISIPKMQYAYFVKSTSAILKVLP